MNLELCSWQAPSYLALSTGSWRLPEERRRRRGIPLDSKTSLGFFWLLRLPCLSRFFTLTCSSWSPAKPSPQPLGDGACVCIGIHITWVLGGGKRLYIQDQFHLVVSLYVLAFDWMWFEWMGKNELGLNLWGIFSSDFESLVDSGKCGKVASFLIKL